MNTTELFEKKKEESNVQYLYRIGSLKEAGVVHATWHDLSGLFNAVINPSGKAKGDSHWRKSYRKIVNELGPRSIDEPAVAEGEPVTPANARDVINEITKQQMLTRDERKANLKALRTSARAGSILQLFEQAIQAKTPVLVGQKRDEAYRGMEVIAMLGDIHYGIAYDSLGGKYSPEIAAARIQAYAEQIISYCRKVNTCRVVLMGDLISGIIHKTIQVENRETIPNQVIGVSRLVSWFIERMCQNFGTVYVYSVSGNHSRLNDDAMTALRAERLDALVPAYCKAELGNYPNLTFVDGKDETIAMFKTHGKTFVAVHGDFDANPATSAERISNQIGHKIDYMLSGHMHVAQCEFQNINLIRNGSVCGSGDEYTMKKRLFGPPVQVAFTIDEHGSIVQLFPMRLDGAAIYTKAGELKTLSDIQEDTVYEFDAA